MDERKIVAPQLEVREVGRTPASLSSYVERAELVRVLAHLVGLVGDESKLLKGTAAGQLRAVLEDADGYTVAHRYFNKTGVRVTHPMLGEEDLAYSFALLTAPFWCGRLGTDDASAALAAAGTGTIDYSAAANRLCLVQPSVGPAYVYHSTSSGGKDSLVGIVGAGHERACICTRRYLDVYNPGPVAGDVFVRAFELPENI